MAETLIISETGKQLHGLGLRAELNGEVANAQGLFDQAEVAVMSDCVAGGGSGVPADEHPAVAHQLSEIGRDRAFNRTREAIRYGASQLFINAIQGLTDARRATDRFVTGDTTSFIGRFKRALSRREDATLISDHADTLNLMARTVTAQQVALGEVTMDAKASAEARAEQRLYGHAYRLSLGGQRPYTTASIAICGARQERINGAPLPSLAIWLGRAGMAVVRGAARAPFGGSIKEDAKNTLRAAGTIVNHSRDLVTRQRAFSAARNWRRI